MQLGTNLCERHGLPMRLVYQEGGFIFSLKKDELEGELPRCFLNVSSQKGRWVFSNMELVFTDLACCQQMTLASYTEEDERKNERRP